MKNSDMLSKSESIMSLIWRSVSENWVFPTAVGCYTFCDFFYPSSALFCTTPFFCAVIPTEMLLQVIMETNDIVAVHWWIWY